LSNLHLIFKNSNLGGRSPNVVLRSKWPSTEADRL